MDTEDIAKGRPLNLMVKVEIQRTEAALAAVVLGRAVEGGLAEVKGKLGAEEEECDDRARG